MTLEVNWECLDLQRGRDASCGFKYYMRPLGVGAELQSYKVIVRSMEKGWSHRMPWMVLSGQQGEATRDDRRWTRDQGPGTCDL